MASLQSLVMNNNTFQFVDENSFENLAHLTVLDLSNNTFIQLSANLLKAKANVGN
jgi:Leucine-rich repeat (LRR) protein